MRISFAWWNTSLSPVGKRQASPEQRAVALQVITDLTRYGQVDCLALGEVTSDDVKEFLYSGELSDYDFYDGTLRDGRLQFDTVVLYRKQCLTLVDSTSLIDRQGARKLKVANRMDFQAPLTDRPFHVFVSHWPSRQWRERNGSTSHLLGMRLRDAIVELHSSDEVPPYAILLGDFNDEPFDFSLSEQLLAVRDRQSVRRNPHLLYNPFWRYLGESLPHVPGAPCRSYCGSYYHASGVDTRWRTFDQIIFSAPFVGDGDWQLNEAYTQILHLEPFAASVSDRREIFDHFPVISVIEREVSHD